MSIFTGCATALITPFFEGRIDFAALNRLVSFQLDNGCDALVICGTTGEASTMSFDEKLKVIEFVVRHVKGKVPVIAGTGGNNTQEVIKMSLAAQAVPVDALLVVTPYYNKTSQAGLVAHYNAIADAVNIPIIAYNVPSRTGMNLLPATMQKLMQHKNIVGIKEASGNIEQIVTLSALCPDCDIYCGNDDHVLPAMSVGAKGVISTISNIVPQDMHDMCEAFFNGDIARSRELQFKLLPMCRAAFAETNPIPIKKIMELSGYCRGELRLPLIEAQESTVELIIQTMQDYGIELK